MRKFTTSPFSLLISSATVLLSCHDNVHAYSPSHTPPLSRRVMAGLWRLTSSKSQLPVLRTRRPMKEFTVYPKKTRSSSTSSATMDKEFLLMLKEDGSFQQYGTESLTDSQAATTKKPSSPSSWGRSTGWGASGSSGSTSDKDDASLSTTPASTTSSSSATTTTTLSALSRIQGTWDFRDGKLILAADRPPDVDGRTIRDTMLVGTVVATRNESLVDHPVLKFEDKADHTDNRNSMNMTLRDDSTASTTSSKSESTAGPSGTAPTDTHLSVPKGKVEVGKFAYPKKHPSFFDQPMFQSTRMGSFELRQVLGSLNTQFDDGTDDKLVEKFRRQDFYDKRFLLTSHPIEHKPRGKTRWSIKYNQYVEDSPKKSKQEQEREKNAPIPIRVMELMLFSNNTFATVKGLGDSILRGKWDIVGKERDQLWMQVWRFGFGRSVSGSVYSEGRALSHNDAKTYWGEIGWLEADTVQVEADESTTTTPETTSDVDEETPKRLQVKGSVIYGWGLEPQPVARFLMTESDESEYDDDEDWMDDNDDDVEEGEEDDALDWDNSFQ